MAHIHKKKNTFISNLNKEKETNVNFTLIVLIALQNW